MSGPVRVYTREQIAEWEAANRLPPPPIDPRRAAYWAQQRAEVARVERAKATRAAKGSKV